MASLSGFTRVRELAALAADLERMQYETLPYGLRDQPRAPSPSEAIEELKDLEAYVAVVLAEAELLGQTETANRLRAIDQHRVGLADRARQDAAVAVRDTRRALAEVAGLEQALTGGRTRVTVPMEGMLEAAT